MLNDLRYAFRQLIKSPGFSLIAILTLALGIGANSAIFSVVNAVLLRPLPFPEPNELAMVWNKTTQQGESAVSLSYPDAVDIRERSKSIAHAAVISRSETVLEAADQSQLLQGLAASSEIFPTLDLVPFRGTAYGPERDQPDANAARVVLISHALWQSAFGADPKIVGRQIRLASRSVTIIGVLPPHWVFPVQDGRTDYVMPLGPTIAADAQDRGGRSLAMIARLRAGVTLPGAQAELNAIAAQLAKEYPDTDSNRSVVFVPLADEVVGNVRPALLIMFGAVALLLLIACANVANLLLARAAARSREMAIRSALGASRVRIIRQLLAESFLLALAGALGGLLIAWWGLDLLLALVPGQLPRAAGIAVDPAVGLFTFGVAVLSTLLFGLLPALQLSRRNISAALQQGGRGASAGVSAHRLRGLLVISQVALSLLLLIGAGLLLRSFANLRVTQPGFDPTRVMTADFVLNGAAYPEPDRQRNFYAQFLEKIRAIPGVAAVGAGIPLPFGGFRSRTTFTVAGGAPIAWADHPLAAYATTAGDYFSALKIPIRRGRDFQASDHEKAEMVAIVNEAFARKYFPGKDAVGETVLIDIADHQSRARRIVGVAGDSRLESLGREAEPQIYVPFAQDPGRVLSLAVRTRAENLTGLNAAIRAAVQQLDRGVFVPQLHPMNSLLSASLAWPRFNSTLLGLFAAVAMVLAAIGIYGVIAYNVAQRTKEIGIRMALGARRRGMLTMILRQSLSLVGVGMVIGLAAAAATSRLLSTMLYGVGSTDLFTYAGVVVLLGGAAFLASLIPARRAMKVDPMVALRTE